MGDFTHLLADYNKSLEQKTQVEHQSTDEEPKTDVFLCHKDACNEVVEKTNNEQLEDLVRMLSAQPLIEPVYIKEPAFVLTEQQLRQYILQTNRVSDLVGPKQEKVTPKKITPSKVAPSNFTPNKIASANNNDDKHVIDSLADATLGTIGRVGHSIVSVADHIIDIITLGYSKKK